MKETIAIALAGLLGFALAAKAEGPPQTHRVQWVCVLTASCFAYRDDTGEVIAIEKNVRDMIVVGKKP